MRQEKQHLPEPLPAAAHALKAISLFSVQLISKNDKEKEPLEAQGFAENQLTKLTIQRGSERP